MKTLNQTKINFLSLSENESFARTVVSAFVTQLDPTVEEMVEIRTAVSEAVTNCIVHAYKNRTGNIEMSLKILEGNEIYIRIKDTGCGIADVKKAVEPLFTTSPNEERAGLGFSVMESFMDKMQVRSKADSGTVVIMRKKVGA